MSLLFAQDYTHPMKNQWIRKAFGEGANTYQVVSESGYTENSGEH